MEHHPLAEIIPPATAAEFAELKADIAAHGLINPILTFQGLILDGRHRAAACDELGVPLQTEEFIGSEEQARARVISLNAKRRHLTPGQLGELAASLVTTTHGGSRVKGPHDPLTTTVDEAAATVGVSPKTVKRAIAKAKAKAATTPPPAFKPAPKPASDQPINVTPETQKAMDAIKRIKERGEPITEKAVVEESGVSQTPARRALHIAQTRAALEPVFGRDNLSPSAQTKFDSALKRAVEAARIEIQADVRAEVRKVWDELFLPQYKQKLADAERVLNAKRGVFTKSEYRKIVACLHPDGRTTLSEESLSEARNLIQDNQVVLVKPEPALPRPGVPPLPKTYEELMAAKAAVKAARAEARAARTAGKTVSTT